jgi:hypothetical protein
MSFRATFLLVAGLLAVASATAAVQRPATAPSPSQLTLSRSEVAEVVEAAAAAYAEGYVFAARGRAIAAELRRQRRAGRFDSAGRPAALAELLTAAIRAVEPDRHIEVLPPQPATAADDGAGEGSRAERLGWIDRLRRRNYDFVRAERLRGNVGLLRIDSFPPPELAAPTAAAAMAFLEQSDALIIDLRENGGGTGDMVQFLASYFFAERTPLLQTFRRAADPQTTTDYTLAQLPGRRMPIVDLFILTSPRTFSAAEAFAFALQQRGRAVIVGETSGGGGNAGRYRTLPHGFRAFVPMAHAVSPVTERSWEGIGVLPDLAVSATEAESAAHREALRRLLAAATDETRRAALREAIEALGPAAPR